MSKREQWVPVKVKSTVLRADAVSNALLRRLARVQAKGGVVAIVDCGQGTRSNPPPKPYEYERGNEDFLRRARAQGVHVEELLVSRPDNVEHGREIVETLKRSGAVDLVAATGCRVRR